MKLTVLGKYGPYPQAGGCCSAYLLETKDTAVAVEFGCGALSRLLEVCPIHKLDAVLVSHGHYDHCGDIPILGYAIEQGQGRGRLPLYAPTEILGASQTAFAFKMLAEGDKFRIGSLQIGVFGVQHNMKGFGMFFRDESGRALCYTGDTRYFDALPLKCQGADALLADVCFVDEPANGVKFHLTAAEAGMLAQRSGCKKLLCTHIWGGGCDEQELLQKTGIDNACVVQEGCTYEI